MIIGQGFADRLLTQAEVQEIVRESLAALPVDGKRVLVIIPDGTRTMPMPLFYDLFEQSLGTRVSALDYIVALGTHQPMNNSQLGRLIGREVVDGCAGARRIFNHEWQNPAKFADIGTIRAAEIDRITGGLMSEDVPVRLNRIIFDYDQLIICGPVFPHEVVGFSGGNKYFFPGIAGPEIINFTHWLGAVMTNYRIIGAGQTAVRAVIDCAADFVKRPKVCFALVVVNGALAGLYFGEPREAWQAAARLSAQRHVRYVDKPFRQVFSVMPHMYDDLWTAAKGMYKMEPAVADGGEVIIYAPHVSEVSYTHGRLIDEIGYHCRDYFLNQWDKFRHYPGGVLAHATHLKGMGTYDAVTGKETPRIKVTLATGISPERCRRINLAYLDPGSINFDELRDREAEGILVVPRAGEVLYRIRQSEKSKVDGRGRCSTR